MRRRIVIEEEDVEENSVFENTGSVKIFVEGALPTALWVCENLRMVEKFIPKIKRCFRCQRYGHIVRNCTHPPRCLRCGGSHTEEDCTKPLKCINCGEPHLASDRNCIIFRFNVDVVTLRAALGNNLREVTYMTQALYQKEHQVFIEDSAIVSHPVAFFSNPEQEYASDSEEETVETDYDSTIPREFTRRQSAPGLLLTRGPTQRGVGGYSEATGSRGGLISAGQELFG